MNWAAPASNLHGSGGRRCPDSAQPESTRCGRRQTFSAASCRCSEHARSRGRAHLLFQIFPPQTRCDDLKDSWSLAIQPWMTPCALEDLPPIPTSAGSGKSWRGRSGPRTSVSMSRYITRSTAGSRVGSRSRHIVAAETWPSVRVYLSLNRNERTDTEIV